MGGLGAGSCVGSGLGAGAAGGGREEEWRPVSDSGNWRSAGREEKQQATDPEHPGTPRFWRAGQVVSGHPARASPVLIASVPAVYHLGVPTSESSSCSASCRS